MLRMLLADDDPVFLSKLERLLTQYAAQQQRKVWIDAYPRDDLSGFVLQSYDIAFLDIDFGDRRGAGIDLARRLRQKRKTKKTKRRQMSRLNITLQTLSDWSWIFAVCSLTRQSL